jgi:hypothetical protein
MDHEESAPGAIGPVTITRDELLAILDDIRARVATGDSFEGHVEWMIPGDPGASLEDFDVRAGYRTGNLQGQGGMRVIGVMPQGPC